MNSERVVLAAEAAGEDCDHDHPARRRLGTRLQAVDDHPAGDDRQGTDDPAGRRWHVPSAGDSYIDNLVDGMIPRHRPPGRRRADLQPDRRLRDTPARTTPAGSARSDGRRQGAHATHTGAASADHHAEGAIQRRLEHAQRADPAKATVEMLHRTGTLLFHREGAHKVPGFRNHWSRWMRAMGAGGALEARAEGLTR